MAATEKPQAINLKDYKPSDYLIETVDLTFELAESHTQVTARTHIIRNPKTTHTSAPLSLMGEELELVSVKLNDKNLTHADYQLTNEFLTIPNVPQEFDLEIVTNIKPQNNTTLSGLYRSKDIFCTQCEAEGFRRMTYFIDRPDVLARYTTTIIADKKRYPVLLSNGNLIKSVDRENGYHAVTWQDPFKKPSYLFALVAGDLDCLEDHFVTMSKRKITLRIYVDKGQLSKADYAMQAVKKSMAWDEVAYGREYDLDIFMIVAINDFNMGAMENKGLNLFNSKYVLVDPKTATDVDYEHVDLVVGHEYFHNWSGDRVTCRDWFQLSLKEGLTVFREQEFTADITSHLVERIQTVRDLRSSQFREDAGPLAHPVQPQSYIQINNFYTMTIYNKGSEVIRMMKVLLGKELFRKGMDLYFARYDGQAVTIEELIHSLEEASGRDLTQFRLWYSQAGTPELNVKSVYDATQKTYTLTVTQTCPPTPQQSDKKPFHIPVAVGLLDKNGKDMPLQLAGESKVDQQTKILELHNAQESFQFVNITEKPIPSLLRHFSAPVKINYDYTDAELKFLLAHDSDGFNRWEAGQKLASGVMMKLVNDLQKNIKPEVDSDFIATFQQLLVNKSLDKSFLVELLSLPSESALSESMSVIDVDGIHHARKFVRQQLAQQLKDELLACYQQHNIQHEYKVDLDSIAVRRLKNACLNYLMLLSDRDIQKMCLKQFNNANNMTDQLSALMAFANCNCPEREEVLTNFYNQWQNEALVLDKWFAIQARSELPGTLDQVKKLLKHPAFTIKNPNKVKALIGVFCQENLVQFHASSGEGYVFLAGQVLQIDPLNPIVAARLLEPLTHWRRHNTVRQKLMHEQLQKIVNTKAISKDVYEIAAKSLV